MPTFTYTGDEREYPSLPASANAPVKGKDYDLKADPGDGRWKKKSGKPAKKSTAPTTHHQQDEPEPITDPEPTPEPTPEPPAEPNAEES